MKKHEENDIIPLSFKSAELYRGGSRDFQKEGRGWGGGGEWVGWGALNRPPWLPDEENLRFQMV